MKSCEPVVFDKLSSETIRKFLKLKFLKVSLLKLFENCSNYLKISQTIFCYSKSSKTRKTSETTRSLWNYERHVIVMLPNGKMTIYRTHLPHLFVLLFFFWLLLLLLLFGLNFAISKFVPPHFLMNVLPKHFQRIVLEHATISSSVFHLCLTSVFYVLWQWAPPFCELVQLWACFGDVLRVIWK